jgi:hypothetical protein
VPAESPAGSRADRHAHRGSSALTLHVVLNGGGCAVSLSWSALLVGIELLTRDTAGRPLITLLMRPLSSRNLLANYTYASGSHIKSAVGRQVSPPIQGSGKSAVA